MKTITFLLPHRNPFPVGGFKIVYEYANRFVQDGYSVNIILPATLLWHERGFISKLKGMISYPWFAFFKSGYVPYSWFNLDRRVNILWVKSLNEKNIPDADYIFATACGTAVYLNQYSRKKGIKYYLIQHKEDWDFSDDRLEETYKYKLKKIVISSWLEKLMASLGEKSFVIYDGLDFDLFNLKTAIDKRDKNKVLMLYHPIYWKGADIGISVFKELRLRNSNFKFTMFGAYPRPKNLPDYVSYFQSPNQEVLVNLYNETSIFLGTSFSEGWGITIAEAMQCGCAVVCTDVNGYNEIVCDNETGLLSPAGDHKALSHNILRLHQDDELRLKIAKNGYQFIQKFPWKESYKKMKQFLENGI